jgi:outer membrane protein OmpA-like peptidoglycan-associated protein
VQLPCYLEKEVHIVLRTAATIYIFFPKSKNDLELEELAAAAAATSGTTVTRSDGGLAEKLEDDGWTLHAIQEIHAQSEQNQVKGFETVLSRTFLKPATYILPRPRDPAVMGLAVKMHHDVFAVHYDALGRFVISDGLCRNVPVALVVMPERPAHTGEGLNSGGADSDDLEDAVVDLTAGQDVDDDHDDDANNSVRPDGEQGKRLLMVIDGLGEGELHPMLESLGLMVTAEEQEATRIRKLAVAAAASIAAILKSQRIHFLPASAALTSAGKAAVVSVATALRGYTNLKIEVHGHTSCTCKSDQATCFNLSLASGRCESVVALLKQDLAHADLEAYAVPWGCKHAQVSLTVHPFPLGYC